MSVIDDKVGVSQAFLIAAVAINVALMLMVGKNSNILSMNGMFNEYKFIHFYFPIILIGICMVAVFINIFSNDKKIFNAVPLVVLIVLLMVGHFLLAGTGLTVLVTPFLLYPFYYGVRKNQT